MRAFVIGCVAGLVALPLAAQEAPPEDGAIAACLSQGHRTEICICASVLLHTRLGDANYRAFSQISQRILAIENGATAEEGELGRLTSAGYRFFVPHGQSISVCREKLGAGE